MPPASLLPLILAAGLGLAPAAPPGASARSPMVDGISPVEVRLLSEAGQVVPGQTVRVGVHFSLAPGWHIYWQNPGGAGFPTEVLWQSDGMDFGPLHYPKPQLFEETDDITTYGYANETLLVAAAHVSDNAKDPVTFSAEVRFLACNTICSPGTVRVAREMAVGATSQPAALDVTQAFADFDIDKPSESPNDAGLCVGGQPLTLLLRMLGLALLGGVILNAMPCVLPVLAMKTFGLIKAQQSPHVLRRHALLYALGVIGSMLALASAVVVLRAWGHRVGWGFQFQSPGFVASLAATLLLLALNCFGIFELLVDVDELSALQRRSTGHFKSVLDGVLAVLVSTPCSAPALGTAVAFALAQPAWVVAAVFAAVGLGLALPWSLLVFVPALRRWVPRPGPWMEGLKQLFGFALLATSLWLLWIFSRLTDADALARLMALLWGLSGAAFVVGKLCATRPERTGWALTAVVVGFGLLGNVGPLALDAVPTAAAAAAEPMAYSEARLAAELAEHHPVLVDFTADWCITCKFNERHVLGNKTVIEALAQHRVTTLKADWTRRDPALLAELTRHGRVGVPMVLLFDPRTPETPRLLPEVMTVSGLRQALAELP